MDDSERATDVGPKSIEADRRAIRDVFLESGLSEADFEEEWPGIEEELLKEQERDEDEMHRQQFREHMQRTF